jgi:hypothetical protein
MDAVEAAILEQTEVLRSLQSAEQAGAQNGEIAAPRHRVSSSQPRGEA